MMMHHHTQFGCLQNVQQFRIYHLGKQTFLTFSVTFTLNGEIQSFVSDVQ